MVGPRFYVWPLVMYRIVYIHKFWMWIFNFDIRGSSFPIYLYIMFFLLFFFFKSTFLNLFHFLICFTQFLRMIYSFVFPNNFSFTFGISFCIFIYFLFDFYYFFLFKQLHWNISTHTEKSFRNLIILNWNKIVFTIFRMIWNSKRTVSVCWFHHIN